MGKGDLRTKRGKIHRGTYGNTRLRKKGQTKQPRSQQQAPETPAPRARPAV